MMLERFAAGLHVLGKVQKSVRSLHPALAILQPVAIAVDDQLLIYAPDASDEYQLALETPVPMPIPVGVRAAFNLAAYENRMVCVVTGEIFDEPDGNVILLHEFVHCYQANTCEMALKQSLTIARDAMAQGNFMWELEYPFPYDLPAFEQAYTALFAADDAGDAHAMRLARQQLSASLAPHALEYLRWQEWKEGLARWLENRMRCQLGIAENHYGRQRPYHRVSFYEGGAAWIEELARQEKSLPMDLERLFQCMAQ